MKLGRCVGDPYATLPFVGLSNWSGVAGFTNFLKIFEKIHQKSGIQISRQIFYHWIVLIEVYNIAFDMTFPGHSVIEIFKDFIWAI